MFTARDLRPLPQVKFLNTKNISGALGTTNKSLQAGHPAESKSSEDMRPQILLKRCYLLRFKAETFTIAAKLKALACTRSEMSEQTLLVV